MTDNQRRKAFRQTDFTTVNDEALARRFKDAHNVQILHNYSDGDREALYDEYLRRGLPWPGLLYQVIHPDTGEDVAGRFFATEQGGYLWLEENAEHLDPKDMDAYAVERCDYDDE